MKYGFGQKKWRGWHGSTNFVARQKNGVGQNFGVADLGPLNFGMGRKHGVGQKEFSLRCIVNIPLYLFMVFLYF